MIMMQRYSKLWFYKPCRINFKNESIVQKYDISYSYTDGGTFFSTLKTIHSLKYEFFAYGLVYSINNGYLQTDNYSIRPDSF